MMRISQAITSSVAHELMNHGTLNQSLLNHAALNNISVGHKPLAEKVAVLPPSATAIRHRLSVMFVLLKNFSMASFTSAVDALVTARLVDSTIEIKTHTCSIDGERVMSDIGIEVVVEALPRITAESQFDMLVICGGYRTPLIPDGRIHALIQSAVQHNKWVGGLWNGSYYMAQEGLLRGSEVSIHPDSLALLSESFPAAHPSDRAYVISDRLFSCAGPGSAMQVMIEICGQIFGHAIQRGIQVILACDMPASEGPSLVRRDGETQLPYSLRLAIELMRSNIEEPLLLEEIARYVNLSRRQMERQFSRYLDMTPSRYYIDIRLQQARRLLLQSHLPVIQVAVACGFISPAHFSRAFRATFGVSPNKLRFQQNNDE